jgi:hypothetical protein
MFDSIEIDWHTMAMDGLRLSETGATQWLTYMDGVDFPPVAPGSEDKKIVLCLTDYRFWICGCYRVTAVTANGVNPIPVGV